MSPTGLLVDVALPRVLQSFAQGDRWWFPARMLPTQGEFNIIVHGTPHGPFACLLESIDEKQYRAEKDLFDNDPAGNRTIDLIENQDYWLEHGMARVGYNKRYFERAMEYEVWEPIKPKASDERPRWGLVRKKTGVWIGKKPPAFYWRYYFATAVEKAEIQSNAAVDMIFNLTIEIESPRRAFFYEGDWIGKVNSSVTEVAKEFVRNLSLDQVRQLTRTSENDGEESLVQKIMRLSGESREEAGSLRDLVGVIIRDARFEHADLSGSAELARAAEGLQIAELEAAALKKRGEGERDRDLERAKGRKALVEALGSQGAAVAQSQAIAEAKPGTVIFGNSGITPAITVADATKKKDEKSEEKQEEDTNKEFE